MTLVQQLFLPFGLCDLFVSLLCLPIAALDLLLVCRCALFHPALKFILVCESLDVLLYAGLRLPNIGAALVTGSQSSYFLDPFRLLSSLLVVATRFSSCLGLALLLERIVATATARRYEHMRGRLFSCAWFICAVVISFSVMFSQLSITPAPKPASPDIPAVAPERITFVTYQVSLWLAVVSLLELLIFALLSRHNKRLYAGRIYKQQLSLSEGYQLSENLQTAVQLLPVFLLQFVNTVLQAVFITFLYYSPEMSKEQFQFWVAVRLFAISCFNLLGQSATIRFHPVLCRRTASMLSRLFRCTRVAPCPRERREKTDGIELSPAQQTMDGWQQKKAESEAELHFKQLNKMWEKK